MKAVIIGASDWKKLGITRKEYDLMIKEYSETLSKYFSNTEKKV